MRHLCLTLIFSASVSAIALAQQPPVGVLTPDDFLQLHSELGTCPDEPWRSIPWKTSVVEAQQAAAVEGKPIFIWAMDGHPLGCT